MTTTDITNITLARGAHDNFQDGACLLEAASYLAGEPFSDAPQCVSPVLGAYGRRLNDRLNDSDRQRLKQFLPQLLNTAGDGLDEQRKYLAADWSIRTGTPRLLDAAGLTDLATQLRDLRPITDDESWLKARTAVRGARDQAWEVRRKARENLTARIRAELDKRGVHVADDVAAADAAAAAVADAVADADAAAVAAAVADAVAAAVAAADAVAAAAAAAVADAVAAAVAVAVAVADAVADAVAVADADAAAVAAAVADADADAAAVADAVAAGTDVWGSVYRKVRDLYRDKLTTTDTALGKAIRQNTDEGIELLGTLITGKAVNA